MCTRELQRHHHIASFPGPCTAFGCTKEREGPGMFSHVRDVKGRKVVERTMGDLGLRRAKVPGNLLRVSG